MATKLKIKKTISLKAQPIVDGKGTKSPLFLTKNCIAIGSQKYPKAKLHIIDKFKDSNGNTLILGETNSSNLRMGYHENYTWIQSHSLKPLFINELGNNTILNLNDGNVGIGTKNPKVKLDIKGILKTNKLIITNLATSYDNEKLMNVLIDKKGNLFKDNSLEKRFIELESQFIELKNENENLKNLLTRINNG